MITDEQKRHHYIVEVIHKKKELNSKFLFLWALTDSNRRPSACKADALNQLS